MFYVSVELIFWTMDQATWMDLLKKNFFDGLIHTRKTEFWSGIFFILHINFILGRVMTYLMFSF